jgi:hypothetical protein
MIRRSIEAVLLLFVWLAPQSSAAEATTSKEDAGPRYWLSISDCSYGTEHFTKILMVEESVFEGGGGFAGGRDLSADGLECNAAVPTKTVSDPLTAIAPIADSNPTLLLAVLSGSLPEKLSETGESSFGSTLTDHLASPIYMDDSGRWQFGPWQADNFSGALYPNPAILLRCSGHQAEEVIPSNYLIDIRHISCAGSKTQTLKSAVFVMGLGAFSYRTYDKLVVHPMVDVPLEFEMYRATRRYIGKSLAP